MNWIDECVAVGGWKDAFLRHDGIDVIDIRKLFYGTVEPLVDEVQMAVDQMVALTNQNRRMLIRCREGKDRAPFIAMVYLSRRYGIPYEEAYELVKQRRPQTVFHWDWVDML
jgi:protein-tyrosine phosphatase